MVQINVSPERNVEIIRQKNLEDNQRFLQNLLMINIRNDFVHSARSILCTNGSSQIKKKVDYSRVKVDRATRYGEKVKSGEIGPFIPRWERQMDEKKKEAEKRLLEKERRKLENERKRQEIEIRRQENEIKRQERLLERELKLVELEIKMEEKEKRRLAKIRPRQPSKWSRLYANNVNPYARTFKPRHTKLDERIQQHLF